MFKKCLALQKSFYTGTHLLEPEFERIMWYIEDKTLKKWIVVSNLFFSNKMASFACKSKQNLKMVANGCLQDEIINWI